MFEVHRLDIRGKTLVLVDLAEGSDDRERFDRIREALKDAGAVASTARGFVVEAKPDHIGELVSDKLNLHDCVYAISPEGEVRLVVAPRSEGGIRVR